MLDRTDLMKSDNSKEIVLQLASLIVESVNLNHVDPLTLNAETKLMDEGLELDSVDILECVVVIEQKFGVKIKNADQGREVFQTLGTIANFIQKKTSG